MMGSERDDEVDEKHLEPREQVERLVRPYLAKLEKFNEQPGNWKNAVVIAWDVFSSWNTVGWAAHAMPKYTPEREEAMHYLGEQLVQGRTPLTIVASDVLAKYLVDPEKKDDPENAGKLRCVSCMYRRSVSILNKVLDDSMKTTIMRQRLNIPLSDDFACYPVCGMSWMIYRHEDLTSEQAMKEGSALVTLAIYECRKWLDDTLEQIDKEGGDDARH